MLSMPRSWPKQQPEKLPAAGVYRTASAGGGWQSNLGVEFKNRDFAAAVDRAGVFSACTEGPRGDKHLATFYNESRGVGRDDGQVSGNSTDRRAGACSNLIHHVRTVGNGWSDGPGTSASRRGRRHRVDAPIMNAVTRRIALVCGGIWASALFVIALTVPFATNQSSGVFDSEGQPPRLPRSTFRFSLRCSRWAWSGSPGCC